MSTVPIDSIVIGERARKDMGDLATLAASIKRNGLLHPVVITREKTLVAGYRRIEAFRLNGLKEIAVTVADIENLLSAERDENSERKDFTPSEAVAIGKLIEDQERPKAEERKRLSKLGPRHKKLDEHDSNPSKKRATVAQIAAKAVGMRETSYRLARDVVVAAESDPEKFGDLPALMDETKNVQGAYNEMNRRKGAAVDRDGRPHRHPVFRKMSYPKANKQVERAVWAADGICSALDTVSIDQLDVSKVAGWAKSIKKSAAKLLRFAKRISNDKS